MSVLFHSSAWYYRIYWCENCVLGSAEGAAEAAARKEVAGAGAEAERKRPGGVYSWDHGVVHYVCCCCCLCMQGHRNKDTNIRYRHRREALVKCCGALTVGAEQR